MFRANNNNKKDSLLCFVLQNSLSSSLPGEQSKFEPFSVNLMLPTGYRAGNEDTWTPEIVLTFLHQVYVWLMIYVLVPLTQYRYLQCNRHEIYNRDIMEGFWLNRKTQAETYGDIYRFQISQWNLVISPPVSSFYAMLTFITLVFPFWRLPSGFGYSVENGWICQWLIEFQHLLSQSIHQKKSPRLNNKQSQT